MQIIAVAETHTLNSGARASYIRSVKIVGHWTRFLGGEALGVRPIAVAHRAAESAHTDIVGGLGSETCKLGGGFIHGNGEGAGSEVGGGAVLTLPLVAACGTSPAQFGSMGTDIGDGEV